MTTKLLGQAEWSGRTVSFRLARKADPTRKRHDLRDVIADVLGETMATDPEAAVEQGRRVAHALSLEALSVRAKPAIKVASALDTFGQWFERWAAWRLKMKIDETSRHILGHMREHFGSIAGVAPHLVTTAQIEAIVTTLDEKIVAGTLKWKTAANIWGTLSKACADMVRCKNSDLRVRTDNPALGVQPPERGVATVKQFLYPSEYLTLVTSPAIWEADGSRVAASMFARRWMRAITLAIYLEPRAGELRSLRWTDIDLEHWTCRVERATKRDTGGKEEKDTKTGRERTFEIEPAVRPLLLVMHAESGGKGRVCDLPHECDLSERFRQYLEWSGVKREGLFKAGPNRAPITWRDLRATGITWRALRGDDHLRIQRAAGHTSFSTTQGYIRIAEDAGRGAGEPFPPVPAIVLGRQLTAKEAKRLAQAWPNSGPKISKSANSLQMFASPAGFEPALVPVSTRIPRHFGPTGPSDRHDRNRSRREAGPKMGAAEAAIRRALDLAIASGDGAQAGELAETLAGFIPPVAVRKQRRA